MFVISEEVAEVLNNMTPETRRVGLGNVIRNLQEEFNLAGEANGYAPLDENAKVPLTNMPATVFQYKGAYNATTNSPALEDGEGNAGDTYRVTTGGTQDFGSGNITFAVGDKVVYNGTTWEKWDVQDETVPAGTVISFAGAAAPTGYLTCDGAAVSRSTYVSLFSAIGTTHGAGDASTTFNLPDMRGLFVRGAGAHGTMAKAAGGAFNGGGVGATSNDQMQGHRHDATRELASGGGAINSYMAGAGSSTATGNTITLSPTTDTVNGTPRTGNETKPASISLLYCIKT